MSSPIVIIQNLKKLDYDDLELLRDLLRHSLGEKVRRHGKTPLVYARPKNWDDFYEIWNSCSLQSEQNTRIILEAVKRLHRALSPVMSRRGGKGYIEIKHFIRWRMVIVDNKPELHDFHYYYPYLRVLATSGSTDRKRKKLKSIYLGNAGMYLLLRGILTQEDIIKEYDRQGSGLTHWFHALMPDDVNVYEIDLSAHSES